MPSRCAAVAASTGRCPQLPLTAPSERTRRGLLPPFPPVCGIGAILDPAGSAPSGAPQRMVEALRHRGPDGEAVTRHGPLTLVHTRLAIIDVEGGDQPPDCEVVAHAYEERGPDCARQLNGIFAFALWARRERRLVAARDAFGVKPLYWCSDGRRVAVASEVGALLAAGLVKPEVDEVALDHFLACRFVPAPRTLFAGVSKLPPASLLIAGEDAPPTVHSYREPPGDPLDEPEESLADQLAERFSDAVERQMMSDVPYGAFLSGGVDSAGVVAAMARRAARAPTTFTIGFPGHGSALDEREAATESARVLGTEHHDTAMEQTDFLSELALSVPRLEEPCGIPSAPALMQLSRFAAGDVKVVLAGQGADEPHGGYGRHQAAAVLRHLGRVPGFLAGPAAAAASALPRAARARRTARLIGRMDDAERIVRLIEITDHAQRSALSGRRGDEAEGERLALAQEVLSDVEGRDLLERALYLDTRLVLPDAILLCNDKMSMAASLELRVPFLDLELMRFVERIPAPLRVRPRGGKHLHREALRRLLPQAIVERPKHGFSTPYDRWLRESLGAEVQGRYAPGSELAGLIDPDTASRLVEEHRRGRADHKGILYCLLELSEWHRVFVQAAEPRYGVSPSGSPLAQS